MITYQPLEWLHDRVKILDQTLLPSSEAYIETSDFRVVAEAIKELRVRGAPAIGVAAGYGIALGAAAGAGMDEPGFRSHMKTVIQTIEATRPTARNLFWAAERMRAVLAESKTARAAVADFAREAEAIHAEETEYSRKVSENGYELLEAGWTVLTHCNTGPLATTGYGTALGVIFYAFERGKKLKVLVDETRPLLQGSRLTTWELQKAGVPFTLITDSMAGHFMAKGEVQAVIVGADCITSNGDTANKIGTYSVAVLATIHQIPFYVAAPTSTVDMKLASGAEIQIEQRAAYEVTHIKGVPICPEGVEVSNPAFDVTPSKYISGIVTERGIIRQPLSLGLSKQALDATLQRRAEWHRPP